ncbi:L,D-transpeptidase family protein [Kitasatospora sp. NPDC059803]|uniref:L,D-transpeptidase family protein n=1 Tax=Kitasatospora sp. NPDC059803 TaxID=3346953 RepID=UPI0036644000
MSGSHRATTYPSYEPIAEPVYGVPQQPYGAGEPYQQPVRQDHYGEYGQLPQAPDGSFEAYEQPFQPSQPFQPYAAGPDPLVAPGPVYAPGPAYDAEPVYAPESVYDAEPVYAFEPEPVRQPTPPPVAAPVGARAAARGHRRKAKKKRHGKAVMAGTALLVAAAAGWYTVGQDDAKPVAAAADGPGPEGVSTPDQPAPAARAAADRQTQPPAADRSQVRADGSVAAIPGLGADFVAKIPTETTQVVLASGQDKNGNKNTVTLWTRTPEGRWLAGETWQGHNGNNGWTTDHNEGDLRSPIGVFALSDAGGRKADPGSKLPYDKDPSFVVSGTGFFGDQLAGSFDYVVAINYNRVPGNSPLDPRRPMGAKKGGGIWIHVDHDGPTHGCVSIPEDKMAELIRTLDPAAHPVIVMGDAASLSA